MAQKKSRWNFKWWLFKTGVSLFALFLIFNWIYQIYRKPSEIAGFFERNYYKNPKETWVAHGDTFKKYSTPVIPAEVLAALAQTETQGNSIARTFWRWRFTTDVTQIYAPASSASGLLQITDGTYKEAKKLCISNGKVFEGPRCFFNFLYNRLVPSHAVEMTSAYLHKNVLRIQDEIRTPMSTTQKQDVAVIMHLCGVNSAETFAKNGFYFSENKRCGAHSANRYLRQVKKLANYYASLK